MVCRLEVVTTIAYPMLKQTRLDKCHLFIDEWNKLNAIVKLAASFDIFK